MNNNKYLPTFSKIDLSRLLTAILDKKSLAIQDAKGRAWMLEKGVGYKNTWFISNEGKSIRITKQLVTRIVNKLI